MENRRAGEIMDDGRSAHRRRALKAGKVVLSDWKVMDCTIRDLSDGGARLEFGTVFELPHEFRLLVVATNLMIPAELAWQRGQAAGVRFTGPGTPASARKL